MRQTIQKHLVLVRRLNRITLSRRRLVHINLVHGEMECLVVVRHGAPSRVILVHSQVLRAILLVFDVGQVVEVRERLCAFGLAGFRVIELLDSFHRHKLGWLLSRAKLLKEFLLSVFSWRASCVTDSICEHLNRGGMIVLYLKQILWVASTHAPSMVCLLDPTRRVEWHSVERWHKVVINSSLCLFSGTLGRTRLFRLQVLRRSSAPGR